MEKMNSFPYFPVEFNKNGQVHNQDQVDDLLNYIKSGAVTDVIVISHGWNNDMNRAREIYESITAQFKDLIRDGAVPGIAGRDFIIMGILWPSKKFADADVIASGAAGAGSPLTDEHIAEQLETLKGGFDAPDEKERLTRAQELVPRLEDSRAAREEFVTLIRGLVSPTLSESHDEDAQSRFMTLPPEELFNRFKVQLPATILNGMLPPGPAAGIDETAKGRVANIGKLFGGIKAGALNILNFTTYYQMKERAGKVGSKGLNPILRKIKKEKPEAKIHLIGHSFGGRLVTAAAAGENERPPVPVDTMTLLQAAFSHYGFSADYGDQKPGFFRSVMTNNCVKGPILISHSKQDTAVGTMYPLASMLAKQIGSALGDENDKYGGIGRNGAQKTAEAVKAKLLKAGENYEFTTGKLYNLNGDLLIKDHSDITGKDIAYVILKAIGTT